MCSVKNKAQQREMVLEKLPKNNTLAIKRRNLQGADLSSRQNDNVEKWVCQGRRHRHVGELGFHLILGKACPVGGEIGQVSSIAWE